MSELLRLANDLIAAREWAPNGGDWEPFTGPYEYTDYALAVIRGYQELLRHAADMLSECSSYGHGLWNHRIDETIRELRDSLPEEGRR